MPFLLQSFMGICEARGTADVDKNLHDTNYANGYYKCFFNFIINYIYHIPKIDHTFMKERILFIILVVAGFIAGAQGAKVYGTVYEWSDFEKPLKNVIVELDENSTKVQVQYNVSTTGTYVFDHISPGSYLVKGRYYSKNILEYAGEENVSVEDMADVKNIDLLLFPPTESEIEYPGDINLTDNVDLKKEYNISDYIIIIPFLAISGLVVFRMVRKKKRMPTSPNIIEEKRALPEDLQVLYDLIVKRGGRTTQKDLRNKMACSEAKVSLMITDLENRGLIEKIKKGRSNIIIARK
jgi:uncharacterized membrane protein